MKREKPPARAQRKNRWRAYSEKIVREGVLWTLTADSETLVVTLKANARVVDEFRVSNRRALSALLDLTMQYANLRNDVATDMLQRGQNRSSDHKARIVIEEWRLREQGYLARAAARIQAARLDAVSPARMSAIIRKFKAGGYDYLLEPPAPAK